jgi:hypothetical protein
MGDSTPALRRAKAALSRLSYGSDDLPFGLQGLCYRYGRGRLWVYVLAEQMH